MKHDLIFIIPICMDLKYAPETILDIAAYIKRPYRIVFVDDTPGNTFKDFQCEKYETISSGGPNGWLGVKWTYFNALLYVLAHYDFDFIVYMDEDATVVGPGFDGFIYRHHAETDFDLLAPKDIVQDAHQEKLWPELDTVFAKYNQKHKQVIDFQPSIFWAIMVHSKRFVLRMRELGILEDKSLRRSKIISDAFISYVCDMIVCKLEAWGGMNQSGEMAKPPILGLYDEGTRLKDVIDKFAVLHRTKQMIWDDKELNETDLRAILRDRREAYLCKSR